jgi:glutamyl/glutaminyl-tRNA synthetase
MAPEKLEKLLGLVQSDLVTLQDSITATKFYFVEPTTAPSLDLITKNIFEQSLKQLESFEIWNQYLKQEAKKNNLALSKLFPLIREILTGSPHGPHVQGIFEVLGATEVERRLKKALAT